MRRMLLLMLALTILFCGAARAEDGPAELIPISCEEQGFTTRSSVNFGTKWEDGSGLYVYTEYYDSIPYVLIFRSNSRGLDLARYFSEEFTPYMREKYGDDLVGVTQFDAYSVAGRDMVAAQYVYKLNDSVIVLLRAGGYWGDTPVFFGAKYVLGEGDATLDAMETLVANFALTDEAEPAAIRDFGTYDDSRFSMTLPAGWQIRTTGEFGTLTIKAWDPAVPERSISFCIKLEPFLKSQAAKDWYARAGSMADNSYTLIGGAPVLSPPTVACLLEHMRDVIDYGQKYAYTGLMLDTTVLPDLNDVRVLQTIPGDRPFAGILDNSIAQIAFKSSRGASCGGLFSAMLVDDGTMIADGVDVWFYSAYSLQGFTAPVGEFEALAPVLLRCLSSFELSQQYIDTSVELSNQQAQALLEINDAWQRAIDASVDAWSD